MNRQIGAANLREEVARRDAQIAKLQDELAESEATAFKAFEDLEAAERRYLRLLYPRAS